jgi:CIC family chloride channel protein
MQRFTELNLDELPVVETENASRLLGMLRRKDAIARYNQALLAHKQSVLEHS